MEKGLPPMPWEMQQDMRSSWIESEGEEQDDYLYDPPSLQPPSPLSPSVYRRPRAPTPSASTSPINEDTWSPPPSAEMKNSAASLSSPSLGHPYHSPLLRSASTGDPSVDSVHPIARTTKSMPDPSQYPDPYPFRPPHHHLTSTPPGLSSADSSSASTRSSAYTSNGSGLISGDYGHVHVASGEDDSVAGMGISPDVVVQLLARDASSSTSAQGFSQSRMPPERWSESFSSGVRSRSSSVGNGNPVSGLEYVAPRLQQKPSYDMGWQAVDERDEVGMSEEETDDDPVLGEDAYDDEDNEEERTSAIVIAEEGRGLIVNGDGLPITQLQVQPGTTHLLIGSSSTPNAMPSFLTNNIPPICSSLLALDISANFLGALPPVFALCTNLEELNIASNPLRVLPVFLADLTNLRVLIADSTGISTLPDTLADLDKLHTVSVRRNKMHALPSWLCLLPALQSLFVDGNPFQGPWKALVEPLLAKVPMTPLYPPSTPMFPLPSASIASSVDTETDTTDVEDLSDPPSASASGQFALSPEDEDHTITPERASLFNRSVSSPMPSNDASSSSSQARPLVRTRTTPNRSYYNKTKSTAGKPAPSNEPLPATHQSGKAYEDSGYFGDHEIRKMKSAGDLRRGKSAVTPAITLPESAASSSSRPALTHYATSLSSSNLLNMSSATPERPGARRFASLGPSSALGGSPSRNTSTYGSRGFTQSVWDSISENGDGSSPSPDSNRVSFSPSHNNSSSPPHLQGSSGHAQSDGKAAMRPRYSKEGKEKGSRWGFLKKMSMGKMKVDSPSPSLNLRSSSAHGSPGGAAPMARANSSAGSSSAGMQLTPERLSRLPQINMRISTTGNLDAFSIPAVVSPPTIDISGEPENNSPTDSPKSTMNLTASSSNLLVPPSPALRSAKRRSFLPIETPFSLSIPETSAFVPGVTATNDYDPDIRERTPSPVFDNEQYLRKEEERAREGYMRALRSVMAYLKDMNDLGLSQQVNTATAYGPTDEYAPRSRRPTVTEGGPREVSMALSGSTAVSSLDSNGQLRSTESMAALRSGKSGQTISVATTDSSGSLEERKFKDDKGKRAMVVKEIVLTERTYVKGLQELVDIYIKPGCAPANMLSGVGSTKDTIVPVPERKIVFGGIDSLFSFHKDSFLPALEIAAAPLMRPSKTQDADADGQISLKVAKAVGNIFLKHAAFMKMYSSYINNFDNSVQRVKYWTSDRAAAGNASPASAISPASSTAQLVGLGITMSAMASPGVVADGGVAATGVPNLSSSQKKRIRSYLKRCRMSPRHSQLNLEGYLLLPVQRVPRYRLLLEELLRSTPPSADFLDDPLERALSEISSLANNMNEGKREAESRRKLVQWQAKIRGKFPSPLVQPHRRLIMDGPLLLTRVVRKAMVSFEAINGQGDASTVQVDCLAPELTPRPLIGILCNDLLVLCRDPSEGQDPGSPVDLWAVLRMQTLPQPASIVHGNALRLVDNKAILYFDAPSPSDALNWYRAINLHIPASKT